MANDAVLTRENLRKRNWDGDPSCVFCDSVETIHHLFFQCPVSKIVWLIIAKCLGATNVPLNLDQCWLWCEQWFPFGEKFHSWGVGAVCWAIWKCRNKAVFDKKLIKNPMEIICYVYSLMMYWSGLYNELDKEQMEGAKTMLRIAQEVMTAQTSRQVDRLLLHEGDSTDSDGDRAWRSPGASAACLEARTPSSLFWSIWRILTVVFKLLLR